MNAPNPIWSLHSELVSNIPPPMSGFELREYQYRGHTVVKAALPEEIMGHLAAILLMNTGDGVCRLTEFHKALGDALADVSKKRMDV